MRLRHNLREAMSAEHAEWRDGSVNGCPRACATARRFGVPKRCYHAKIMHVTPPEICVPTVGPAHYTPPDSPGGPASALRVPASAVTPTGAVTLDASRVLLSPVGPASRASRRRLCPNTIDEMLPG